MTGSIASSWVRSPSAAASARASACVSRRGVRGGHDRGADALGAERVSGQAGDERRVDPAGEAEHDALEAVLAHVVAQAERERAVDLGLDRRERLGERPARFGRSALGWGGGGQRRQQPRAALGAARGGSLAGIAQARRGGRLEVDVAHEQLLAELRGARDRRAGVVDHARVPVEHELVLAADEPAEGDAREVLSRALGEHVLALGALAGVVGRGGDVEDQRGARQRLFAGRRAGLPDVLADGQAKARGPEVDDRPAGARLEVALLVEHAVVGQVDLAVDRAHLAPRRGPRRR